MEPTEKTVAAKVMSLAEIQDWLLQFKPEYEAIRQQGFPPLDNENWFDYHNLNDLVECTQHFTECLDACNNLYSILDNNMRGIGNWCEEYEWLGVDELVMFLVRYEDWTDYESELLMKINDHLYTEKAPFYEMHLFCEVFSIAYWENEAHMHDDAEFPQDAASMIRQLVSKHLLR